MDKLWDTKQLRKTLDLIGRTQEAIRVLTDKAWFTEKTALFLVEIGVLSEENYKYVLRFIREV